MSRATAILAHGRPAGGKAAALLAAALLLTASGASAGDPWQLRCESMPVEQQAPAPVRAAALRFFPWVHPAAKALRAGPVYLVALSTRTAISRDGDDTDTGGYYLHRALLAIAPSYGGPLTLRGDRVGHSDHRGVLGFSTDGATHCTVNTPDVTCASRPLRFAAALKVAPDRGWRIVRTELRIGRTGCFQLTATGPRLHGTIPLAVPGPDYGTPGW